MDKITKYDIAFTSLKNGKHNFIFDIDQEFFDLFEVENEFTKADISASVLLDKHSNFLEFAIEINGCVVLICDISGNEYNQSIHGNTKVVVKFGHRHDDTDGEMIIIPQNQSEFNVAKLIFEVVVLSIPMKRLSPNLTDEDFKILDDFSVRDYSGLDSRWSMLKKIKS